MTLELRLDAPMTPDDPLVHWIHLTQTDLLALSQGIVTEQVQACAQLGCEHVNDLFARCAQIRQQQNRRVCKCD